MSQHASELIEMTSQPSHDFAKHQKDFERIYARQKAGDNGLRFPLEDVDKLDWNRGKNADDYYSYMYRRFSSHILDSLQIEDGMDILSLGCGGGSDEKNIKRLYPNCRIWSIDISEQMLRRAIDSQSPSQFVLGVAESLPFPTASFDRIVSREVIEHVAEPMAMMKEVNRVLKPGGRAVITTENEESWALGNDRYESIKAIFSRFIGIFRNSKDNLPDENEQSYKDDAPTLDEFKDYAATAKLDVEKIFWDGSLYMGLPVFQHILGPRKLVKLAHYLSCLENNPKTAFWFCDQVKYIVSKPADESQPCAKPILTKPGTDSVLVEADGALLDESTGTVYQVLDGIPNLLPKATSSSDSVETMAKVKPKTRTPVYNYVRTKMRFMYRLVLLLVALGFSIPVKKNKQKLSLHITDNSWEKFIRLSLD